MNDHSSTGFSNPLFPVINLSLLVASTFMQNVNIKLETACHIAGILSFVFYAIMNAEKIYHRGKRLIYKKHRSNPIVEEKEETEDIPE